MPVSDCEPPGGYQPAAALRLRAGPAARCRRVATGVDLPRWALPARGRPANSSTVFCAVRLLALLCWGVLQPAGARSEPVTPESEGAKLAARLLALRPAESFTNSGVMQLLDAQSRRREFPVTLTTTVTATNWLASYTAPSVTNTLNSVLIVHAEGRPNQYFRLPPAPARAEPLPAAAVMSPFAGCDFWLADLGLEFLHWPGQRILKTEMRRGESCRVLESTNPQPAPGAYSRVVSWVDIDTGGILHADAYGADRKLLKVFEPKKFQKVNGRWEVKTLQIRNAPADTRTTLLFDLPAR